LTERQQQGFTTRLDRDKLLVSMFRMFVIQEAINSVAIEHPEDCSCVVCKAADGDMESLISIMARVDEDA
jgi:hypothetical protein